ncbi:MAG: S46 family peptidase, partial [Acidobacteria bacterium]|nr:S46 family peptidase [Acidobacteriota bacterium]
IENECFKNEGLKGEVVALFGGAKYSLYKFKEYKEVKLVMIPDLAAAFFGGDYDNFTYPRYDLDIAFLRAYENGKPAKTDNYLKVNPNGIKDGDLVFVSGHPHNTNRLETLSMLEYKRDVSMPFELERLDKFRSLLKNYSQKGVEEARRARTILYYVENAIKSMEGELKGLRDEKLIAKKRSSEEALKKAVESDPVLKKEYGGAWKDLEEAFLWAEKNHKDLAFKLKMWLGERGLFGYALHIATFAEEIKKPNDERLPGYRDADLVDFEKEISSPYPIYKDLEELMLAFQLEEMQKGLGENDAFVKNVLQGKTPKELAKYLVEGTKLDDPAFRKKLVEKKGKAVEKSKDPMVEFAKRLNPAIREMEKLYKNNVEAVEESSLTKVAKAGFAVYGTNTYPDGTSTLRLSFGKVAGYPQGSTLVPPFTTFYGLLDRAYGFGNKGDFEIPSHLAKNLDKIDLKTPLNFVSTADITGGNSGSPIVDKEGKLVGVVFDGNAESHPNAFVYDEYQARCVSVDIRAILEVLKKVYNAEWIVDEMLKE